MPQPEYLLGIFTLVIAGLAFVFVIAVMRLTLSARSANRRLRESGTETALLTSALQQAVTRIREQERATHARAEASERLSAEIISGLSSGLLVAGVSGEVRILNPAGSRLLGLPADTSADSSVRDLLGTDAAPLADVIEECLARRIAIGRRTVKLELGAAGHRPTYLGVSVSPMRDERGTLQGAICLFTDLSAVVELEEQVRLQDSLARVGELTAGIAHEFRNGLATIRGYSRLLLLDRLPLEYQPYVQGIRQETEALRQVVDNFLTFARPAQLSLATVDLRRVAERAVEEIQSEAHSRGGEVRIEGEFADVQGDEVLLKQALSNLCRNALEACLGADVSPRIVVQGVIDLSQQQARVTVVDNGPGIAPELRDRIFRPFFTTKATGTGLGLALAQKIVVTHNGRLTAGAASTGGTRMEVVLPLRRAS